MPQRKEIKWSQLRVGILVAMSLIILAVGIFLISGQVGFLSRQYTLKAYLSEASGLREGTQVQLAGIPIGNVKAIRISAYTEPLRAVEVDMRLAKRYQDQIRADSVVTVERFGLLGESYINISRGSPRQPVLADGAELKSREEADVKQIVQNTNDVISNLRVLSAKLTDVADQITAGKGSMGRLIYDQALYNRMNQTADMAQRVMTSIEHGQGTIGKLISDEALYQQMSATMDRLNNFIEDLQHGKGSAGRFVSDPAVYDNLNKVAAKANTFMDNINSDKGTLGRLINDPQLYNRLNETIDRLDSITARMEKGEGTLGLLSTDKTLYNNLSESSRSLREFLAEFRQNPKKYLTVRVKIF
jgi:phospholipid/cholesterol/gamma-HCH transport system substrate-binding protein